NADIPRVCREVNAVSSDRLACREVEIAEPALTERPGTEEPGAVERLVEETEVAERLRIDQELTAVFTVGGGAMDIAGKQHRRLWRNQLERPSLGTAHRACGHIQHAPARRGDRAMIAHEANRAAGRSSVDAIEVDGAARDIDAPA